MIVGHNKTLSISPEKPKQISISESDCLKNENKILIKMIKELKFSLDSSNQDKRELEKVITEKKKRF